MKILAIDTATKTCSVAIIEDHFLLSELSVNHGKTHAAFLMKMIDSCFNFAAVSLNDIDGFAVTTGPGSFTGLRIGLSTIKGLSLSTGKPVVGVSSLDALAHPFTYISKYICPMIDARRGQVYAARYRTIEGQLSVDFQAQVMKPPEALEGIHEPCVFVGDGAITYKDVIEDVMGDLAEFAHSYQHHISASAVAQLSLPMFLNHKTDSIETLVPIYIRKSDAEMNLSLGKK